MYVCDRDINFSVQRIIIDKHLKGIKFFFFPFGKYYVSFKLIHKEFKCNDNATVVIDRGNPKRIRVLV